MTDDPYAERRKLTFEQAEGIEPLPIQLQPRQMPQELRALLWHVVYLHLDEATDRDSMGGEWWLGDG